MERREDPSIGTTFATCPGCGSPEMILMIDDRRKGREEWHCDRCWYAYDGHGKRIGKVYFGGGIETKCPECGDHRIARDNTGSYYCKGCRTAFPKAVIEPIRRDGEIVGCRLTDFGDPRYPKPCPNCAEPLRRQTIEGLNGDYDAYICRECDIAYLTDDRGGLRPWPECPRCGRYSLISNGKTRKCHFCGVRTDLDNEYLDPADKPQHGNRQSPGYDIGTIPDGPNLGGQS